MLRFQAPTTALDARFSVEFLAASALSEGRLGLAELSDEYVSRPQVQAMMRSVKRIVSDDVDPEDTLFAVADKVSVTLRDGRIVEGPMVSHARGHMRNPVDLSVLRQKFNECVSATLSAVEAATLFDRLADPASLKSVADLYRGG
jgi:2-methylcitrate dehydratase PrpD